MTSSPSPDAPPKRLRRGLRVRGGPADVLDGEARLIDERPRPADPVILLYDLYERTAVPLGVACVALGIAFGVIGLLLSWTTISPR